MGQIIGSAAKPKRCNIDKLSQFGTPAAGEFILVSSDNSMTANGQGNFDCYVEGNGASNAISLPIKFISDSNLLRSPIDLSKYAKERSFVAATGKWVVQYQNYASKFIPVEAGDIYEITANENSNTTVCFLKSLTGYHTSASSIDYASGYSGDGISLSKNTTRIVIAPSDATYMAVAVYMTADCSPKKISLINKYPTYIYADAQQLTDEQIIQARKNLGFGDGVIDDAPKPLSDNLVDSKSVANAIDAIKGREANYVQGRYLLSTGATSTDANWCYCADYFPVQQGDIVVWHPCEIKSTYCLLTYDSEKTQNGYYVAKDIERTITIGAGISYIRASFLMDFDDAFLSINGDIVWTGIPAITAIIPNVENTLSSTSETNALSAAMGRELERTRALRIVGDNTNLAQTKYNGIILPNHRYKIHLLNKDFDVAGDTLTTNRTRLKFSYKFADSQSDVTLVSIMTSTSLNDSYTFSIPDGENDVALYIYIRATKGEVAYFVIEDITDSNTSNFANTYIASKCSTFRGLFSAAGVSTLSFLYFTDPHLMGTNGTFDAGKYKEWMGIIENYYHNIPTDFCFCGGDLLNSGDTPAQACDKLGYVDGTSRKSLYPYHFMLGNHDTNYQGTEELPQNAIDAILFREEGKAYYRFDTDNCTCFVFDTGKDNDHSQSAYRIAQYGFFKDGLLADVKDNIVLFFHIYYYNSTNQAVMAQDIMNMAGAFNNRTSVTIAGTTYDFSAVTHGVIRFAIVGHSHFDFDVVDNGIPVIGTLNVQKNGESPSFDMVLADFSNNVINLVRVGHGSDRTIQM